MSKFRFIVSLLLFACVITCHAQVRNSRGQKLVSRIEIDVMEYYQKKNYVKQRVNITYGYDVNNLLQDVIRTVV